MTDDHEIIDNIQRGCGYLKEGKAYVQSPPKSALGTLPTFVELEPPVAFYEDHFRGYEYFPGIAFESAATPSMTEWLGDWVTEDEDSSLGRAISFDDAIDPNSLRDAPGAAVQLESYLAGDVSDEALTVTKPRCEIHRHLARIDEEAPDATDVGSMTQANSHDLIMWVGETYYDEPADFIDEVKEMGLNKAIPTSKNHEPPVIDPGVTRLWLIHPKAVPAGHDEDGEPQFSPGIIGYSYLWRTVITENESGEWSKWQKDLADSEKAELVRIGDRVAAEDDGNGSSLDDFCADDEDEIEELAAEMVEEIEDEPLDGFFMGIAGHTNTTDDVATLLLVDSDMYPVTEYMTSLDRIPTVARDGRTVLGVEIHDGELVDVLTSSDSTLEKAAEIEEAFR
jgi:hypothetical protein